MNSSTTWNDVQGVRYGKTITYEPRNVQHQMLHNCDSGVIDTRKPTPKICSPLSNDRTYKLVPEICLSGISGDVSKIFKTTRNTARNSLVPPTKGQHRLRVFYQRGLQKIFGPKRKWKKNEQYCEEQRRNFYRSPNTTMIKSRSMRLARDVACIWAEIIYTRFWTTRTFGKLRRRWKDTIKMDLERDRMVRRNQIYATQRRD